MCVQSTRDSFIDTNSKLCFLCSQETDTTTTEAKPSNEDAKATDPEDAKEIVDPKSMKMPELKEALNARNMSIKGENTKSVSSE